MTRKAKPWSTRPVNDTMAGPAYAHTTRKKAYAHATDLLRAAKRGEDTSTAVEIHQWEPAHSRWALYETLDLKDYL